MIKCIIGHQRDERVEGNGATERSKYARCEWILPRADHLQVRARGKINPMGKGRKQAMVRRRVRAVGTANVECKLGRLSAPQLRVSILLSHFRHQKSKQRPTWMGRCDARRYGLSRHGGTFNNRHLTSRRTGPAMPQLAVGDHASWVCPRSLKHHRRLSSGACRGRVNHIFPSSRARATRTICAS